MLDPEILSATSSILRPLKFLHSCAKHHARTVLSCVDFDIFYFELLDPEILTNNTQNILGENVDPKTVYIHCWWGNINPVVRAIEVSHAAWKDEFRRIPRSHSWRFFFFLFLETRTSWSYSYALLSRITPNDHKVGRAVSSTYVYVWCRVCYLGHRIKLR